MEADPHGHEPVGAPDAAFLNTVRTEHYQDVMTLTTMIPPFMQKISAQEIAPTPFHPITPNFFRNAFRSLNRSLASFCSSGSLSNTNLCGEPLVMTNILTGRS
jgi:hypothetical protein